MNFIEHLIKFERLALVWQAKHDPNRWRYKVAELRHHLNLVELVYLKNTPDFDDATKFGFNGYPAFPIEQNLHRIGVLEAFMRRLPPRNREDFNNYLEMYRLPKNANIDDFSLLGYTGARLPGDEFLIIPDFENIVQPFEYLIEVAGFRHESTIDFDDINIGDAVNFIKDPGNHKDPEAIKILIGKNKIGHVTRNLLSTVHDLLDNNRIVNAVIERKNGQINKPVLYVFLKAKESLQGVRRVRNQVY